MPRRAFTLMEMMAVVTLLGLMAAATAWSMAEDARRGNRTRVVGDIVHADRMARMAAHRRGQGCVLWFDLQRQRLWRTMGPADSAEKTHTISLPAGFRLARVMTAENASGEETPACLGDVQTAVPYSPDGHSATYAVLLEFEDGGDGKSAPDNLSGGGVWMVFAGLTGQMTLVQDEAEVKNLFATLAVGRPDAH